MALKKIDVSDIEEVISDVKVEEQQKLDIEKAERIADVIGTFIDKSPVVVQAMKEIALSLNPGKFSSQVDADMKRTVNEIAELFNAKIKSTLDRVKRAQKATNRISIPSIAVYVTLISMLWLFAFFALTIYANSYIHSEELKDMIAIIAFLWIITVALIAYLTRHFKW